jgi:hypothetical protein
MMPVVFCSGDRTGREGWYAPGRVSGHALASASVDSGTNAR